MKTNKKFVLFLLIGLLLIGLCVGAVVGLSKNPTGLPQDLRNALVDYLEECSVHHEMMTYFEEEKIDFIKNGAQPLHVAFDSSDYYFVCGYYNHTHEDNREIGRYCCAKEYIWVKFESADKIGESYFGKELVVAFQINRALFVKDLSANKDYRPGMEHFQIYEPKFEDGVNTNPPVDFSETFIYLNGVTTKYGYSYERFKGKCYRSVKQYDHENLTFRCIYFEGQYYIPIYIHKVDADGKIDDVGDNAREYGKYYDAIEHIMETGRYSVENETYHAVRHYGLVSVDDFANEIIK